MPQVLESTDMRFAHFDRGVEGGHPPVDKSVDVSDVFKPHQVRFDYGRNSGEVLHVEVYVDGPAKPAIFEIERLRNGTHTPEYLEQHLTPLAWNLKISCDDLIVHILEHAPKLRH